MKEFEGIFISQTLAERNKNYILDLLKGSPDELPTIVFSKNPENAMINFFKEYHFIEASGGIVRKDDQYLFIKRKGLWDIPKGKIEPDENPKVAAIREIAEECGISCKKVNQLLTITYHVYKDRDLDMIKKTYWYSLDYNGKEKLIPQQMEDITDVKWIKIEGLNQIKKNTYPSIIDVLDCYFQNK